MDGLGFSNEWNEFQDAMYRNAVFRGITKLVFGTLLALFAYLPWRYSRRLRQDKNGRRDAGSVVLEFGVLAFLGFTASCLGIGGSMILSVVGFSYYGAGIIGYCLLFCSIAGLTFSVIAIAVGRSASVSFEGSRLVFALAWIGIILPAGMFALVLVTDVLRLSVVSIVTGSATLALCRCPAA